MVASDIRKEARASLKGKWGKAALITLVYAILTYLINFVLRLVPVVGPIASIVIEIPIAYGILVSFMKLKRGEEVSVIDFLKDGFAAFGKTWAVFGQTILKVIVPIIIAIVFLVVAVAAGGTGPNIANSGVNNLDGTRGVIVTIGYIGYVVAIIWAAIKGLYYALAMMILKDNEDLSAKEIVEKSEELMTGNRWNYIWLGITFFGWAFLAACTCGIGMLWLSPYIQVAQITFYEDRAGILNAPAKAEEPTEEVKE